MQQPSPSEETAGLLARLSQRPGVQGTLILSRETGAIVKSSGLATAEDAEEPDGTANVTTTAATAPASAIQASAGPATNGPLLNGIDSDAPKKGTRRAEDVARLVFSFVQSAGAMVEELNGETDETKLLRVRTKKNELVVVPDSKFLLVVIHDTPPA